MTNAVEKDLICIICPNGCKLHGSIDEEGKLTVSGNRCVRGKAFAGTELTDPTRSLTTTVKTTFSDFPYLPVRTNGEIPKNLIPAVIEKLFDVVVSSRFSCGDTVVENIFSTGIDIVATTDM